MNDRQFPCRVSADLRQHEAEQFEEIEFDEWDDDLMHDVCGKRFAKPIQTLLISLSQVRSIQNSFGDDCVKKAKFFDQLVPELEALKEAVKSEWEDQ